MRPAYRLLQACRITLFTRQNCQLCVNAKDVLSTVWDERPFVYREVDVMTPEQKDWRNLYEFDTPVIHVTRADLPEEDPELCGKASKLMHRFTKDEVEKKMNEAEGTAS